MSMPEIHGHCDPRFEALQSAFTDNFAAGEEIGACLALFQDGDPLVDIWAGHADRKRTEPWQKDTLVNVYSTGKAVAALLILMLIDRDQIELDAPVARYWPEFAANGKAAFTVRDALTYRTGVPGFATPQPWDTPHDWERMTELIAREAPWFETRTLCYHPNTYGFIIGELIRRVTGKNIHEFGEAELFRPLDADFHFQLDPRHFSRVASLIHDDKPFPFEEGSIPDRAMSSIEPPPAGTDIWETPERMTAIMPGSNNYTNARSLAKIGSVMTADGTVAGHTFLSPEICREARNEQVHDECPCMGDLRLGLTFGLDGPGFRAPSPSCVHWGGYGGSWLVMDPATGFTAAYAMNRCFMGDHIQEDPRQEPLWAVLSEILETSA